MKWDLELSGTFVSFAGNETQVVWNVPASAFPGGQRTAVTLVRLNEPGTLYYPRWNQLDVAIKKSFRLCRLPVHGAGGRVQRAQRIERHHRNADLRPAVGAPEHDSSGTVAPPGDSDQVVVVYAVLVAALLAFPASSAAQSRRPAGEEWNQVRPLFALVERVAAGEPAPADVDLSWQCHFVDADAGVVLVPFTLDIRRGAFSVVSPRDVRPGRPEGRTRSRPWSQRRARSVPLRGRGDRRGTDQRAASAGHSRPRRATYDVYVALTERPSGGAAKPRRTVVKQEVTIPDLKSGLTTSSIIVAEQVEADSNGNVPRTSSSSTTRTGCGARASRRRHVERSNRAERLSVLFLVYQAQAVRRRQAGCRSVVHRAPHHNERRRELASQHPPGDLQRCDLASDLQPERRRPDSGGPADCPRRHCRTAPTGSRSRSRTDCARTARAPNGAVLR